MSKVELPFVANPAGEYMAMEAIVSSIGQRLFPGERENFEKLENLTEATLRLPGESLSMVMPGIYYLLEHGQGKVALHIIHQFNFWKFSENCRETITDTFSANRAAISLRAIADRPDKHEWVVAQMLAHPNCSYEMRNPTIDDISEHLDNGDSIVVQLDGEGLKDPNYKVGKESQVRFTCIVTGLEIDNEGRGRVFVNLPGVTATKNNPKIQFDPQENYPIEINRFMELWNMDEGNSMPFYALGKC